MAEGRGKAQAASLRSTKADLWAKRLLGVGDIHRLNGVKNVLGTAINGTAAGLFAAGAACGLHDVAWREAGIMAAAGTAGALAGSHLARRLPATVVRRGVAVIGFALAAKYFFRP